MTDNARKISRAFFCLIFASISQAAFAAQPQCYRDIPTYMVANFGPAYEEDENILIKEQQYGTQTFTMVADMTPGTNIIRTLFRQTDKDGFCVVLKTLPAAQLKVVKTDKAGVPLDFITADQAPGTEAGNEIIYSLGKSKTYLPTSCKKVTFKGKKVTKKSVPCPAVPNCGHAG